MPTFIEVKNSGVPEVIDKLMEYKFVAIDTETYYDHNTPEKLSKFIYDKRSQDDTPTNRPFIVTMSADGVTGYKIYINNDSIPHIKRLAEDKTIEKVFFNADYDLWMLLNEGIEIEGRIHDVMLLHNFVNEEDMYEGERVKSLKTALVKYVSPDADKYEKMVDETRAKLAQKRNVPKSSISYKDVDDEDPHLMTNYACFDPVGTMLLFNMWYSFIDKWQLRNVYEAEMACIRVVLAIERTGHLVSNEAIKALDNDLKLSIDAQMKKIFDISGRPFNVNSTAELVDVYEKLYGEYPYKTEKDNYCADDDHLKMLLPNELIQSIMDYRAEEKLFNTFLKGLETYKQIDGRVHPTFWLGGARTGRFSSSHPNFQNYPKPKTDDRIRTCFIPTQGYKLLYFDYEQQEYRLLAHYANETKLIEMIEQGYDVHRATASLVFGVPIQEVTDEQRDKGKTTNFALVYGLGNAAFAKNLGKNIDPDRYKRGMDILSGKGFKPWRMPTLNIAREGVDHPAKLADLEYVYSPEVFEAINYAKSVKEAYFKQFPNIKQFLEETREKVANDGFIRMWSGRIKHYNDPKKEAYKGVNALIQGGCADIMKSKLPELHEFLKPYKSRIVNLIHDEFSLEIHESEEFLVPQIKELLTIRSFNVTIDCDIKYSTTCWADKKKWEVSHVGEEKVR